MAGPRKSKGEKYELFIAALLLCGGVETAARRAGISESTAWRWRRDPAFQQRYKEARQSLLTATIDGLRAIGLKSVQTLDEVLSNKETPAYARTTAATNALTLLMRGVELHELVARIEQLEKNIGDGQ